MSKPPKLYWGPVLIKAKPCGFYHEWMIGEILAILAYILVVCLIV